MNSVRMLTLLPLLLSGLVVAQDNKSETDVQFSESEVEKILSLGPWPQESSPDPGNELSGMAWAEQLGEQLFSDTSLSPTNTISCQSCHQEDKGFSDGVKTAVGVDLHFRNSPGLMNVGLQRWFGWDGGTDSLWAAALRPLLSEIEMGGTVEQIGDRLRRDPSIIEIVERELGIAIGNLSDDALMVFAAKSIGAYTRTLQSPKTAFDLFRDALATGDSAVQAAYPVNAKKGLKIFLSDANCQLCHSGPNFSNGEFHDTGRSFFTGVGSVDPGRYRGIQRVKSDPYNLTGKFNGTKNPVDRMKTETVKLTQLNWGQWKTPSLRNLTSTSPYTHDGSLATLRDVIDAYADIDPARLHAQGEAILAPLELSDTERENLVAFLQSLSR